MSNIIIYNNWYNKENLMYTSDRANFVRASGNDK
jgi:hypothetical protein